MRLSAAMIGRWADSAEAKGLLPVLVRRLIAATADLTELAVRGADTNNFPGWDGAVTARTANAWVPADRSCWEMGCSADVIGKARSDFQTRSAGTPADQAREIAFVFVTPRIWAGKDTWRAEAEATNHWRLVRAYDADDLDTWLETAGSVALWLGELLGVRGPGVSTVASYWDTWRNQTKIPISHEALVAGRAAQEGQFNEAIVQIPALLTVCADSSEEAVAFACAQLDIAGFADRAVCVAQPDGWSFVDANPTLQFLVAANASVAAARAPRAGQCLIVPTSIGDLAVSGPAGAEVQGHQALTLDRPDMQSFENALIQLGEEPSDAGRWARSCGRSWSVYRRRRASNAAIVKPLWLQGAPVECLTTIVLVGAWNEGRAGDRICVEAVTGRRYEEVERDLRRLAQIDDAPILRIGNVWKAKASLELLYLFAPSLTDDQLDRFFSAAQAVLATPDPALELEPDLRWMAAIYGRVRNESGIVIGSIVDSLIKLRVYAEENQRHDLMARVDRLVRDLLKDANGDRWLSLCGVLRELAEASPDLFLRLLDESLRRPDAPVRALFSDHSSDGLTDQSYHIALLWALEILAWSPKHLGRVCDALARLIDAPVKSNMLNRPSNTLASLLRPWWPQTTAGSEVRLQVLDRLIRDHEQVAWKLMLDIIPAGTRFASANAAPRWRDFDAGASRSNELADADVFIPAVGQRVLDHAEKHADRIASLVKRIDSFEGSFRERILAMLYGATVFPDIERLQVRDELRRRLSWQFSFNADNPQAMTEAKSLRTLFDALAPNDLVLRHTWLFTNGWVDLPDGKEDDFRETNALRTTLRAQAFSEVFHGLGWAGVERLAEVAQTPGLVGWELTTAVYLENELPGWALRFWTEQNSSAHDGLLRGLLHGLPADRRIALLDIVHGKNSPRVMSSFLLASPFDRHTWEFVDALSLEARAAYWLQVDPGDVLDEGNDTLFVVDKLVDVGRHRTAFNVLRFHPERAGSTRLVAILNEVSAGAEPEGGQLDGFRIGEALTTLSEDKDFPRRDVAVLEYRYFDALRHGRNQAQVLFSEMSRDPEFFMDVINLATPDERDGKSDASRSHAWRVLHEGRGTPGLGADGVIDSRQFFDWIDVVRRIARERDRTNVVDSALGTWISKCPSEPGGAWPCVPVRELLDDPGSERIRNGFVVGVLNNRGMHSREMGTGGSPERSLASQFRASAADMWATFPRAAETLEDIAKSYDRDAKSEDDDVALWREG